MATLIKNREVIEIFFLVFEHSKEYYSFSNQLCEILFINDNNKTWNES